MVTAREKCGGEGDEGAATVTRLDGRWAQPYTLNEDAVVVRRTACTAVAVTVAPASPAPNNTVALRAFKVLPVFGGGKEGP